MESAAAVRLPGPLSEYHRRYPEVTIELHTGNPQTLARAILADELDAALVTEPVAEALFDKVAAFAEELVIVAPAGHPPIGNKGVVPHTVIAFEHGCPHRKRLEDWYAARGEVPQRTIELGSCHAMLGCIAAGMGVALLPRSVLTTFPESRRLSVHALPAGENRALTVLIWRRGAVSPKIRALAPILSAGGAARPKRRARA